MNDYPHVGQGWQFPPRWDAGADGAKLRTCAGAERIRQALIIHVRTSLRSRVMRPRFGGDADRYVFEPQTAAVCHRLADDVRRALVLGEPRVLVDSVTAAADEDRIDVTVAYRIDRHRRPESLIVPFYLAGAP